MGLVLACGPADSGSSTAGPAPPVIDWQARPADPVEYRGWSIVDCEGDAPLLCMSRDGESGTIELLSYPLDSLPEVAAAYHAGGPPAALDAFAEASLASSISDREVGCPAGYSAVADAAVSATVAGRPARRVGFTVADTAGAVVEHTVAYATIFEDTLTLLGTGGLSEGACLERLGEFPLEAFEAALPVIDELVAMSSLGTSG